jgi:hypothetical protein
MTRAALQSPSGIAVHLPERFRAGCAFGGSLPISLRTSLAMGSAMLPHPHARNHLAGGRRLANEPACVEHPRSGIDQRLAPQ